MMRVYDPETGEEIFCHPKTGERLTTQEEVIAALAWIEEQMAPYYRVRKNLRDYATRTYAAPARPSKRNQTDKQRLIERCPRCGSKLEEPEP